MVELEDKLKGGIYGLLLGDAVGVPYEFHLSDQIPSFDQIDIIPPLDYERSYPHIPIGSWSDDGAQALCLLDSLLSCNKLDLEDCMRRFSHWYQTGYMAVDGVVFDIGVQTREAIEQYLLGTPLMRIAKLNEDANGNGALMRSLPLALWHQGTDEELIEDAYLQSHLTHAHLRSKVCCALYCLWARYVLKGFDIQKGWSQAVNVLRHYYQHCPLDAEQLEIHIRPDEMIRGSGSGYVVDCLHSARFALQHNSYENIIKTAISIGHDTDTTACVAGGIAGIHFGFNALPTRWYEILRAKHLVHPLVNKLITYVHEKNYGSHQCK